MAQLKQHRIVSAAMALSVAVLAVPRPATAEIIVSAATLPLIDHPYAASIGAGCFPNAGVCVTAGSLVLTSVASSTFNPSGQDIITDADYTATLVTPGNTVLGAVALTGTIEQEVLGRTFSTATGSWSTDVIALSLSGPVLGHTLTLTLDSRTASTGTTSISPLVDGDFAVSSFFDVYTELTFDSTPPLQAARGPVHFDATPAPEPASLALLILPLSLLPIAQTRRIRSITCR